MKKKNPLTVKDKNTTDLCGIMLHLPRENKVPKTVNSVLDKAVGDS